MKKIVLACGSGIATSTAVANKVSTFLDENGMAGTYNIVQCAIAEAPTGITCPYVSGIPFLTGMGAAQAQQQILDILSK